MRERITNWLLFMLLVEGVLFLTFLLGLAVFRLFVR